jgi:predicted nuclease with TOPRIM domain
MPSSFPSVLLNPISSHQLREIENQLTYKQHQIQAICGQNRYLEDKCLFLSNQYEILEKKFQDVQNRLRTFEEFSIKQNLPGRYDPLNGILG